eukprot:TRINITY_DN19248_c0_g1_i1.p1 TRINITY_DN19248_c0_g1~~TRINITY_DN19248_c0_g1_i1.p1  ORF type:complete len:795 (-),score=161.70 TRINITY_DN19248_c0_g1_i1:569-2953(-)
MAHIMTMASRGLRPVSISSYASRVPFSKHACTFSTFRHGQALSSTILLSNMESKEASWRSNVFGKKQKSGFSLGSGVCSSGLRVSAVLTSPIETKAETDSNPLLQATEFPPYDTIEAKHVVPGIQEIIREMMADVEALESNVAPTWPALVQPLERLSDRLEVAWGAVQHLKMVKDSEELRAAVETVQPETVALNLRLGQSRPLYDAFKTLYEAPEKWAELSEAQKRIVESAVRDAELSGVALEGEKKERFNEIQQELASLSTKFLDNLLDASKAFQKVITDPADVDGLPPSALGLAAQVAASKGHEGATPEKGPWLFTLDIPLYLPIMQHAKNRALREELHRAYISRAASGDLDNTPIVERILTLRQEKAKLLGYESHAEVSMARKMATLPKALELLEDLRATAWDKAVQDLEELKAFAAEQGAPEAADIRQWDVGFWAERMLETKFSVNEEELRPYFSFPRVINGVFALAKELFGVQVVPADGLAPVWHPDVRLFEVRDSHDKSLAYFYLDPYSRPGEKQGGAWVSPSLNRSKFLAAEGKEMRLPQCAVVCNSTPPVGDKPSLMTFREVETVFHEFGHALQHMLTRQDESLVAGIQGIEWDAVELPSQFMENWCYHRDTLMSIAVHYETGEQLPEDIFQKKVAARNFRAASQLLRQVHFSLVDLELHSSFQPGGSESVFDIDRRIAQRTQVMPPLPEDRFLCGFAHIFAGGYAAGYYSYKWAEVLSADAFAAFEEAGLEDKEALRLTGQRFRETVLGLGGGRAPLEVFKDFRGREPSTEPLLRHSGLLATAAA